MELTFNLSIVRMFSDIGHDRSEKEKILNKRAMELSSSEQTSALAMSLKFGSMTGLCGPLFPVMHCT